MTHDLKNQESEDFGFEKISIMDKIESEGFIEKKFKAEVSSEMKFRKGSINPNNCSKADKSGDIKTDIKQEILKKQINENDEIINYSDINENSNWE